MLRIGIARVDNIVLGRVLEQSALPCGQGALAGIAENKRVDGLSSVNHPELLSHILFVRGDGHDRDNNFFARAYENDLIAEEVIEDIKRLVAKVNHPEAEQPCDDLAIGLTIIE